jgi:hypothetical protein
MPVEHTPIQGVLTGTVFIFSFYHAVNVALLSHFTCIAVQNSAITPVFLSLKAAFAYNRHLQILP